jgi:hypothetical protein
MAIISELVDDVSSAERSKLLYAFGNSQSINFHPHIKKTFEFQFSKDMIFKFYFFSENTFLIIMGKTKILAK